MYSNEEKKLQGLQEKLDQTSIPEDRLNEAILRGIHRGKADSPVRKKWWNWNWKVGIAQATVVLLLFVLSIRYIDGFANIVRGLPGMENLVRELRNEPSLQEAVDNNYLQEIGLSDEHDGIKLTVHSVLADEMRMIIFYSVETERMFDHIMVSPSLIDQDGQKMDRGYSMSTGSISEPHTRKDELSRFEFKFVDMEVPEKFVLQSKISVGSHDSELFGTWEIPIEIDKSVFEGKKKEYMLNETFEVEGQKITLDYVSIYPTQTLIHFSFDENNTKKIFDFEDLRLVDENGEVWSDHPGGHVSSYGENEVTYFLESNYFRAPKELRLQFSKLQALDKDELKLVVDPMGEKILERPSVGPEMSLQLEGEQLILTVHNISADYNHFFVEKAVDSAGNEVLPDGHVGMASNEESNERVFYIPYSEDAAEPGPVTIPLSAFPAYIYGEIDISLY